MNVRAWLGLGMVLGVLLGLGACGEEEESGDGSFTQSDVQADGSYTCCLNGSFYECDSSEAVVDCIDGEVSGCSPAGDC